MGVSYDEYKIDQVTVWGKCCRSSSQALIGVFAVSNCHHINQFTHSVLACGYAAVAAAH